MFEPSSRFSEPYSLSDGCIATRLSAQIAGLSGNVLHHQVSSLLAQWAVTACTSLEAQDRMSFLNYGGLALDCCLLRTLYVRLSFRLKVFCCFRCGICGHHCDSEYCPPASCEGDCSIPRAQGVVARKRGLRKSRARWLQVRPAAASLIIFSKNLAIRPRASLPGNFIHFPDPLPYPYSTSLTTCHPRTPRPPLLSFSPPRLLPLWPCAALTTSPHRCMRASVAGAGALNLMEADKCETGVAMARFQPKEIMLLARKF